MGLVQMKALENGVLKLVSTARGAYDQYMPSLRAQAESALSKIPDYKIQCYVASGVGLAATCLNIFSHPTTAAHSVALGTLLGAAEGLALTCGTRGALIGAGVGLIGSGTIAIIHKVNPVVRKVLLGAVAVGAVGVAAGLGLPHIHLGQIRL